jgi:hypothetical protein
VTTIVTVSKPIPASLPSQSNWSEKLLNFTITVSPSPFNNYTGVFQGTGIPGVDGTNSVTLAGVRATVHIEANGAPAGGTANVLIFGLQPSLMNQLTVVGLVFNATNRNYLTISAGDATVGVVPIFSGTVTECFGDYNQAPNVPLRMTCQTAAGGIDSIINTPPSSFSPPVNVASVMQGFARRLNVGFINSGVNIKIPSAIYLRGNLWTQINQLAKWYHFHAEPVRSNNVLAIWPYGGTWNNIVPPLISKNTGMIGSPSLTAFGLIVKMIFNPNVAFGGLIQVQSEVVPQANAMWYVQRLDLDLSTLTPDGKWEAVALCNSTFTTLPTPQPTS